MTHRTLGLVLCFVCLFQIPAEARCRKCRNYVICATTCTTATSPIVKSQPEPHPLQKAFAKLPEDLQTELNDKTAAHLESTRTLLGDRRKEYEAKNEGETVKSIDAYLKVLFPEKKVAAEQPKVVVQPKKTIIMVEQPRIFEISRTPTVDLLPHAPAHVPVERKIEDLNLALIRHLNVK